MRFKGLILTALLGATTSAFAHERYFIFTYGWFTPSRFEREFELTYDHFRGGAGFAQVELEYGVSDRWVVAPYALFSQEDGKFKFAGWQLEQRYRFGDFSYGRVLPAVYFEVHKENEEPFELEAKLIGSYMPNARWIASGNLIVERKIESDARTEVGYSVGLARIYKNLSVGVEAKGNFLENQHFFGPAIGFGVGPGSKILLGGGIGFGQDTPARVRVLFEKEF
jgi:hypothetical protein